MHAIAEVKLPTGVSSELVLEALIDGCLRICLSGLSRGKGRGYSLLSWVVIKEPE